MSNRRIGFALMATACVCALPSLALAQKTLTLAEYASNQTVGLCSTFSVDLCVEAIPGPPAGPIDDVLSVRMQVQDAVTLGPWVDLFCLDVADFTPPGAPGVCTPVPFVFPAPSGLHLPGDPYMIGDQYNVRVRAEGFDDICSPVPGDITSSNWLTVISAPPITPDFITLTGADADVDGWGDACDPCPIDPMKPNVWPGPGICGCNVPDTDTDGDGSADCNDECPNNPTRCRDAICGCAYMGPVTPACISGAPNAEANGCTPCTDVMYDIDQDGDGTYDCNDQCPLDPNKTKPGICGCGKPDVDSDGDGTADCIDPCPLDNPDDPDGDGCCASTPPLDLCPADGTKCDPGVCGCGVPDVDTDGDTVLDCLDGCPADPLKIAPGFCGCGFPETTFTVGGIVYRDENDPLNTAETDITATLNCLQSGYSQSQTTCPTPAKPEGGLFSFENVPCDLCWLTLEYNAPECDDEIVMCPNGVCGAMMGPFQLIVTEPQREANEDLQFRGYNGFYDANGDGVATLVGDLPAMIACVFNGQCDPPTCPLPGCLCRLDCNMDGMVTIIGDLPCLIDCYFSNICDSACVGPAMLRSSGHLIGGIVYGDRNTPLETAVEGVDVEVYDARGFLVNSAVTKEFGLWSVDGLLPGDYRVSFEGGKFAMKIRVNDANIQGNQSLTWERN